MKLLQTLIPVSMLAAAQLFAASAKADVRLPASLLQVPESTATLFVAETSSNRFYRFERNASGLEPAGSYYMSIGQNGPGKQHSGDRRTPIGVYFVTEQLDTSKLHEKYGITAFPLDYPNEWDQLAGRDGDGIWVHGVLPGGGRRPAWDTDGCIALGNEDLGLLQPAFSDNVTPVVVTEVVEWVAADERLALAQELSGRVADWAGSQQDGDLFAWMALYSDDFQRWGMSKPEWVSVQLQSAGLTSVTRVTVRDLLLLAYPDEGGLYLSRFLTETTAGNETLTQYTRLYWRREADGSLRIVAEDSG